MKNNNLKILILGIVGAFSISLVSNACTIYIKKSDNGMTFTKTRDSLISNFHTTQEDIGRYWTEDFRYFRPKDGIPYVALMYSQKSTDGVRSVTSTGVNEDGVAISYNYGTVQKQEFKDYLGSIAADEAQVAVNVLSHAKSVDEAAKEIIKLSDAHKLPPMFIGVSDTKSSAVFEVTIKNYGSLVKLDDGGTKEANMKNAELDIGCKFIGSVSEGIICRALMYANGWEFNREIDSSLAVANYFDFWPENSAKYKAYNLDSEKIADPYKRYHRAVTLLDTLGSLQIFGGKNKFPYNLETAMMFANNHHDGELSSINREETRATFVCQNKDLGNGSVYSHLFLEFTNPGQMYNRADIDLSQEFWNSYSQKTLDQDGSITIMAYNKRYIPEDCTMKNKVMFNQLQTFNSLDIDNIP